jgi:hypothetical protein
MVEFIPRAAAGFSLRPYKKQAAATVFHRVMCPDA